VRNLGHSDPTGARFSSDRLPSPREEDCMSERSARPGLHKDWRTWVVVLVMLSAIGMYVFTLDDSTVDPAAGVPAATGTPP
jgi:hypothetical protein